MPYTAKGKCVYRKDTGKKVGCTKGSVKKYLAALHANVKDVNESEEFDWVKDMDPLKFIRNTFKESDMEYGQLVNGSYTLSVEVPEETNYSYYEEKSIQKELRRRIGVDCYFSMARGGDDELLISITVDSKEELVKVIDWMESDNNLHESEEFDWVENPVQYIKVGQRFNVKTSAEPITVQIVRIVEKPDFNRNTIYFSPINLVGTKYPGVPMNVQRLLTHINSGSWTPIKKINESEDDFEWTQETIKTSFLEFNGKEIMIDIQGLDTEELKRLYDIVIPYAQTNSSRFTSNEGEEISWGDNTRCFENMLTEGKGKYKSISLHCGLEDNDYLPLKGAVCCLKGTYDEEPSYSKENIIPINAREIIGGTINESEWFEDVVKDPITLKVEELEMGDIVIPTCFKQEEFVVTGKGTSVKLLHEPTHWVTLKRNTKANTGGVFIEHDSEIGKACRFELIHREENLNESEDDSELFWAEDLLDFNNPINITDKLDVMEELPVGSILQVQGYQDEMELDMEEVKLIDKAEGQGYDSTYYLFKLKYEKKSDGTEMTHCGQTKHSKICECREGTDDDLGQTEVGKCWWIELKNQNKVIYYPNRIDLSENKIKKPLLTEGRYDTITRKVVRDIMKAVTEGNSDSYNLPWDISSEQEYEQDNLSFSLELDIVRSEEVDSFEVRTAIADEDEENIIMMTIILGPRFNSQKLQKLFYKLQEDIRHEIEHFTQIGPNRIKDRPTYKGSTANLKTTYGHHKNVIEVPALVHGFYRRAKLEKRPIDEIMMDDLDSEIERGLLTKNQAQKLLTLWISYAKKNLPSAIYKEN